MILCKTERRRNDVFCTSSTRRFFCYIGNLLSVLGHWINCGLGGRVKACIGKRRSARREAQDEPCIRVWMCVWAGKYWKGVIKSHAGEHQQDFTRIICLNLTACLRWAHISTWHINITEKNAVTQKQKSVYSSLVFEMSSHNILKNFLCLFFGWNSWRQFAHKHTHAKSGHFRQLCQDPWWKIPALKQLFHFLNRSGV